MNDRILGDRLPGIDYRLRPGAYAVVRNDTQDVGLIRSGRLFFLPGGGSDHGETPEQTVVRETLEECGHAITILRHLGVVTEFFQSREDDLHYEVRGDYFEGRLGSKLGEPIEIDHELVWMPVSEAIETLHRPGHRWAVEAAAR